MEMEASLRMGRTPKILLCHHIKDRFSNNNKIEDELKQGMSSNRSEHFEINLFIISHILIRSDLKSKDSRFANKY